MSQDNSNPDNSELTPGGHDTGGSDVGGLASPPSACSWAVLERWAASEYIRGCRFFRRFSGGDWVEVAPLTWATLYADGPALAALDGTTLAVVAPRSSSPTTTTAEVQRPPTTDHRPLPAES